jgi:hypothetical protein
MEDDRVALLEQSLAQAKQIAEEADKKYEEVRIGGRGPWGRLIWRPPWCKFGLETCKE